MFNSDKTVREIKLKNIKIEKQLKLKEKMSKIKNIERNPLKLKIHLKSIYENFQTGKTIISSIKTVVILFTM